MRCLIPVICVLLLVGCASHHRQEGPLPTALALSCLTCHTGPSDARQARDLRGLSIEELVESLRDFREGTAPGTVMPRLAKALSDAEIEDVARQLGAPPR